MSKTFSNKTVKLQRIGPGKSTRRRCRTVLNGPSAYEDEFASFSDSNAAVERHAQEEPATPSNAPYADRKAGEQARACKEGGSGPLPELPRQGHPQRVHQTCKERRRKR